MHFKKNQIHNELIQYIAFLISAEIIMFEGLTCVYKSNVDLFFYVVGSSQENEVSLFEKQQAY